jgi:opacity protein-like surface antigen
LKKTVLLAVIVACFMSVICYAETLQTARGIGTDNLAIQGFYSSTNLQVADSSLSQFGPRIIYGITNDLDVNGKIAMGSVAGVSATTLGAGVKYTLLKSASSVPIDIAADANFESTFVTGGSWSNTSFGLIFSRYLRSNISAYGILNVVMLAAKFGGPSSTGTGLQFGGGLKFQFNKSVCLLGELSLYTVDYNAYTNFAVGGQFLL